MIIPLQGIKMVPDAIELQVRMARLLREKGDTVGAEKYYKMAIESAKKAGDAKVQDELVIEMKDLLRAQ